MTAAVWMVVLSSMLLLAALTGPSVLRRSAPTLASVPRLAAAALGAGALLWVTGLVFLGPIVAWMSAGPQWLPSRATVVCQRCLAASSPFGDSALTFGIPAFIPLLLPMAGIALVVAGLASEMRQLRDSSASVIAEIRRDSVATKLQGHPVRVIRDDVPRVFALPGRDGGIVISGGALAILTERELSGVLAHERAHVRQRHHLGLAILYGATRYFRWIPVVAAVRAAVPLYLEIAADQAAKRVSGTTAIASALLKLGQSPGAGLGGAAKPSNAAVALHAAGSERVRFLVGMPRPRESRAIATTLVTYGVMLVVAVGVVYWPYIVALLTGCWAGMS